MSDQAACDNCDGVGLLFTVPAPNHCATVRPCQRCDGKGRTGIQTQEVRSSGATAAPVYFGTAQRSLPLDGAR